jgi:hypothetical protein
MPVRVNDGKRPQKFNDKIIAQEKTPDEGLCE